MTRYLRSFLICVLVVIVGMSNDPAQAAKEDENVWDEVTVIGSKENEASLPGSGARITVDEIRNQSYDDINEILKKVPGVYLREEDGLGLFPNISLRGVDPARSSKVTLMEDGITAAPAPYSAPSAYYSPTAGRMSGIEVLKGSSQVKYGPHITGGMVNYISTPIPREDQIYIKQLFGNYGEIRNHTYIGGIRDTSFGKLGAVVEHYYREFGGFKHIDGVGGFSETDDTGFQRTEPMVKLSWEPANSDRYQKVEAKFGYSDLKADETYTGLTEGDFDADPFRRYAGTRFDNIDTENSRSYLRYLTEVTDAVTLSLTGYYNYFQRNWEKLHSISGGSESNISEAIAAGGTSLSILKGEAAGTLNVRNNNRSYAQWGYQGATNFDFDLLGTSNELELGVGYHEDYVRRLQNTESYTQNSSGEIVSKSSSAPGTAGNRKQKTRAVTTYIKDDVKLGGLTVSPGFRYEYLKYNFTDFNTSGHPGVVSDDGEDTINVGAGGVGLNYGFDNGFSVFGGAHQGFSTPGPRDNVKKGLKEETSFTSEAGLRFSKPENPLNLELALFRTEFKDLIVTDNIGGSGSGDSENVGDILSQGVELKAQYDVAQTLEKEFRSPVYVAFTYTNAELDGDASSSDPESIFSGGKDGNKVPYIPELQIAFGTGLEIGPWGVYLDASYVGETFATASNNENQVRPEGTPDARFGKTDQVFVVDLSGHYKINENAKVIVNLQNIGDREYVVSRHPHGPRPGKPFTATAGVELIF